MLFDIKTRPLEKSEDLGIGSGSCRQLCYELGGAASLAVWLVLRVPIVEGSVRKGQPKQGHAATGRVQVISLGLAGLPQQACVKLSACLLRFGHGYLSGIKSKLLRKSPSMYSLNAIGFWMRTSSSQVAQAGLIHNKPNARSLPGRCGTLWPTCSTAVSNTQFDACRRDVALLCRTHVLKTCECLRQNSGSPKAIAISGFSPGTDADVGSFGACEDWLSGSAAFLLGWSTGTKTS